ncbi:hypothetical protein FCM35_KLT17341 [Carex littledalei]|uniref:Uncharacterized protein n=1 Tax=Carex littledalei TaxID=544730 RepID=A0A833VZJ1_9POAL|nr:hypothetical protein FCM35_KLT17341 [Carex littledalei]
MFLQSASSLSTRVKKGDGPETFTHLRNNYWVLRHGRSIPNERGLIVSSLENGTREEFGLAALGIEQAKLAGELFKKEMVDLRERYFGTLDLLVHDKNAGVWPVWAALDEKNPFMPLEGGGESVADVASRLTAALLATETAFEGHLLEVSFPAFVMYADVQS